ncbi:hypothetical protein VIGAN_03215200 [Vigna angularis var. angularis]|uniref:Retrotransposon Copia-like N-terminal domain-containing protein n=1 Tax=Vigna angularis var. angularis TaxID=157739 RepID=A0A0S3RNK2_PHAAN|nr:hypothetical protein VIGAN_03215200 [Vigna angularis var. angularis]
MWDILIDTYEETNKVKEEEAISTLEELSSFKDDEEVKLCLMFDSASDTLDNSNEEVDFSDIHSVIEAYDELMPNSSKMAEAYQSVVKLTQSNYLNWHLQIEEILDGLDLYKFLDGSHLAPTALIDNTDTTPVSQANPAYLSWKRQDRLIYGALLTTLSDSDNPLLLMNSMRSSSNMNFT